MPDPTRDVVAEAREEIVTMGRELAEALYVEHPANERKREREVTIAAELADALIAAAEARGIARLAALTEGEVRGMVGEVLESGLRDDLDRRTRAKSTLLAAFAAQRERVVGDTEGVALGYAAMARRMADVGGERMARSIAATIRALLAPPDAKGDA